MPSVAFNLTYLCYWGKLCTKLDDDTLSSLVFLKAFYKNEALNWIAFKIWLTKTYYVHHIVCIFSLLKVHISYIFLKKSQVFFKLLEKNLTWNFKFKSSQVLLQQVQVRSSSGSAWPGTSSQVKFEHFQVFWTL